MKLNRSLLLLMSCVLILAVLTGSVIAKEDVTKGRQQKVSKSLGLEGKFLDINLCEFGIRNDGLLAFDPNAGGNQGLYYPAGQRYGSVLYTAGLWIVGMVNGDIRSASCQYSSEFQPGNILAGGVADDPTDDKYQLFKFDNKIDPATGELANPITADAIAQGCPSELLGDQMLWCVYNDLGSHEYLNNTNPLGVEVQQTTWGYSQTGALNNTVFMRFRVINKGGNQIDSTYLAIFYDPDLGDSNDDASGADSTNGFGFVYNGDGYDDNYGVQVPAMASDFFQGPLVPAPGQTAVMNDGTVHADMRIMDQTSVFHFINGAPFDGISDPHTAEEQYWFCKGFLSNGNPMVDPGTGLPSKFWLAGDPVSGTGWNYTDIAAPGDCRFGNATGPFQLAPGDTQDIVLGVVCGMGSDNLNSITVMRYYDKSAQVAYDNNFDVPSPPPAPFVQASQLDEQIVLYWNNDAANYAGDGYEFEGYNIYQSPGIAGPWTKIQTYDKANAITVIWDFAYSNAVGTLLEMPVQNGSDTGLQYTYTVAEDALTKTPLVNGKPYYFAVTGYTYNETGTPKTLENSPVGFAVIPQRPVIDVEVNADVGELITAEHVGPSQGSVVVEVIDPNVITDHDYKVEFAVETDTNSANEGLTYWWLTDVTTGEVLLDKQFHQGFDGNFANVDGMTVRVQGPAPGLLKIIETDADDVEVDGNVSIMGPSLGSTGYIVGNRAMDYNAPYPTRDFDRFGLWGVDDFTFDFSKESVAWYYTSGHPLTEKVPFAVYKHDFATGETGRMFIEVYDTDGSTTWTIDGTEPWWGKPWYEAVYAYVIGPDGTGWYDEANDATYLTTDLHDTHAKAGWATDYPIITATRFIDYLGNGLPIGNKVKFITNKPNSPQDTFTFSMAAYKKSQTPEIGKERLKDINVFPNPYFAHNSAEGTFYTQFVTFNNLPEDECEIRIFSLNGELVKTISHTNHTPFESWYLKNEEDVPVGSGMYFAHIKTEFGNVILKLAVINRGAFFRNL